MINIFKSIQQLFTRHKEEKSPIKYIKERLNYRSGYFSPDGIFYGCTKQGHVDLAEKLRKMKPCYKLDAQQILEQEGWIKMSNNELFYFNYNKRPTQPQIDAIFDRFQNSFFNFNFKNMIIRDLTMYVEKNYNGITPVDKN